VVVTKVHLQRQMPGWRLVLDCARLEARYGVVGLFNMQVHDLHLQQLQVDVSASDALPSVPPASTTTLPPALAFPVKQLHIQQGTLRLHSDVPGAAACGGAASPGKWPHTFCGAGASA
jgi:hypothetical protein